jgi:hypothetical protein
MLIGKSDLSKQRKVLFSRDQDGTGNMFGHSTDFPETDQNGEFISTYEQMMWVSARIFVYSGKGCRYELCLFWKPSPLKSMVLNLV